MSQSQYSELIQKVRAAGEVTKRYRKDAQVLLQMDGLVDHLLGILTDLHDYENRKTELTKQAHEVERRRDSAMSQAKDAEARLADAQSQLDKIRSAAAAIKV